jgi:hypothetical protein
MIRKTHTVRAILGKVLAMKLYKKSKARFSTTKLNCMKSQCPHCPWVPTKATPWSLKLSGWLSAR